MEHEQGRTGRRTEQGDELKEEHSLAREEHRPEEPYDPPSQPAQDAPKETEEES